MPRADLGTGEKLPRHGIVLHTFGMAGESTITIDADAGTLRTWASLMGKPRPRVRTRKLPAAAIARLVALATAAWIEEPTGPMAVATDIREDLYVVDGDDGFFLQGHPIDAFHAPTGRPAAARAVEALYRAAR
ncbi:MAG TPA: hypothetical protein VKB80_36440 [Kofleriaceae bacterium]|nr:hypothetical protein [Kofleriaceae bacterium]